MSYKNKLFALSPNHHLMPPHTSPLFHKHNLLTLDNIHSLQVALFMYSVHTNSIPSTFQIHVMFNKNFETHQYSTRQANNYKIQFTRTNILRFSIVSSGPRLWNSLPNDFKVTVSVNGAYLSYFMS